LFSEIYGSAPIRALSRASRDFLYDPPKGFAEGPAVRSRGALHVATAGQLAELDAFATPPDVAPAVQRLDAAACRAACPDLRDDYGAAGVLETGSADLDVDALHQGWLRQLRSRGGRVAVDAEVTALTRTLGGWRVETPGLVLEAPVVVNAAGAWAD